MLGSLWYQTCLRMHLCSRQDRNGDRRHQFADLEKGDDCSFDIEGLYVRSIALYYITNLNAVLSAVLPAV